MSRTESSRLNPLSSVRKVFPYPGTIVSATAQEFHNSRQLLLALNSSEKDNYFIAAIGFYYNGNPYVLEDGVELYRYVADYDRWVLCGYYPGCRGDNSYKTVFVLGDYAYVAATSSNYYGCAPLHFAYRDR